MLKRMMIAAALMTLPLSAAAYSSPEEVLFGDEGVHMAAPPIHRETGDRQEEQRQRSLERREREWAENYAKQHPEKAAATEDVDDEEDIEDQEDVENPEGTEESEEEPTGMTIEPWEDPTRMFDKDGDVLHSGAPLTPTGLGSWFAAGAILAATYWTIRRAKPARL